MNLLLDTHVLLWAAAGSSRLRKSARLLIDDPDTRLHFSVASLWEIVIKRGLGRSDFQVDPTLLRRGLIDNGYAELPVTAAHVLAVDLLPGHHRDPFDRLLLAQSRIEGLELLTADPLMARYPAPVRLV